MHVSSSGGYGGQICPSATPRQMKGHIFIGHTHLNGFIVARSRHIFVVTVAVNEYTLYRHRKLSSSINYAAHTVK